MNPVEEKLICRRCQNPFELKRTQNRLVTYCPDCLKYLAGVYLSTPLPVRVFMKQVGMSDRTLHALAIEHYGRTRSSLSDVDRARLLSHLTEGEPCQSSSDSPQ